MSVTHDQICRLCAEINQSTEDILENNLKEMAELICRYLSITVDTFAEISTKICLDCKEKILNFHNFALKCEHVQLFLIKHKIYANRLDEYRKLKIEFDLQFSIKEEGNKEEECEQYGIKDEKDISDIDYFDDVRSPLSINIETKINPETELPDKITPPEKRKSKTRSKTSKRRKSNQSKLFSTLPTDDEKIGDNENNELTINENVINNRKRRTSKKCKSSTSKISSALPKEEEKMDDNNYMVKIDDLDVIKGNQNDEIINENVMKITKPIKDVATVKEDIENLKLPPTDKAGLSQMLRCDQCFKLFKTKATLKYHKNIHSGRPKIYGCDHCDKKFSCKRGISRHMEIHEPAEKRYTFECSICDRKFAQKYSLNVHINGIHKKIKPHVCDLCGSSFGTSNSLKNHIQTHDEEMKYMCDICDRGFKTQLTLKVHMRRVHRDNVSYTCSHCNKVLKTRASYREHLLIHEEYPRFSCPFCDKKFKSPKNMNSHKRIHTGERPYSCPWCPKTFTHPSNFKMHKIQVHELEFREYEFKMLKDKEEFTKKLREKLAADSSKTEMENNVP